MPKARKNLPDCKVSADAFTPEDHRNLMFGLKEGIDFVALSFIATAEVAEPANSLGPCIKGVTTFTVKVPLSVPPFPSDIT